MMNAIELHGLEKHYRGFTFGPIDLTLPSGCIMGLVGVNGAGKTTLFRLLLGMAKKEGGTVRLLGRDAEGNAGLKEELGVVLESAGFPACLTPAEIGSFLKGCYSRWDGKKYKELLACFRVGEGKYAALSRGMKMKLLLAAALSHEPRLLLLDEATSGLDPVARQDILDIIMEFTRDEAHSVLFSSHIADDLEKVCDYVTFLHGGKVLLSEEKDALLERYGVLNCSEEDFSALAQEAVLSSRRSPYGVTAVVRLEVLPAGLPVQRVGLEELFRALVQEEELI